MYKFDWGKEPKIKFPYFLKRPKYQSQYALTKKLHGRWRKLYSNVSKTEHRNLNASIQQQFILGSQRLQIFHGIQNTYPR